MIAIVDYGVGNLFSLVSSLKALGLAAEVTGDASRLRAADKIILLDHDTVTSADKKDDLFALLTRRPSLCWREVKES